MMILPEFPLADDRIVPRRFSNGKRLRASLILSVAIHLGALGGCYGFVLFLAWLGYDLPEIALRSQRASIELQASIEAAPESAQKEVPPPTRVAPSRKPELLKPDLTSQVTEVVKRKLPVTDAGMLPVPVETAFVAEQRDLPPPERIEASPVDVAAPSQTVSQPKRKIAPAVAPVESVASAASVAVDGSEFDEPPAPHVNNKKPPYPADALSRGIQGVVTVRLRINSSGEVESAVVVESSGTPSLDESARRTALQWRFEPARLRGISVVATIDKPVRFTLRRSG